MGKKYYKATFGYDHIMSVYKALDKHNIPNHVKKVIFDQYKKSHQFKKNPYRDPTIYEMIQRLRAEKRHEPPRPWFTNLAN